jgi:hypothetical protein
MAEFAAPWCSGCDTAGKAGGKTFSEANPDASESDIMYAERMARQARAHTAHRNFVDPRDFSSTRGVIPVAGDVRPRL